MANFDNSKFSDVQGAEERALVFDLGGQSVGWLVDGLAIERAKAQGVQLGEVLSQLEDLSNITDAQDTQTAANAFAGIYPAMARLVWLGMLRFNGDVSYEAILGALDVSSVGEIPAAEMMGRIFPSRDESLPESSGK